MQAPRRCKETANTGAVDSPMEEDVDHPIDIEPRSVDPVDEEPPLVVVVL